MEAMEATREALGDLWGALRRDASSLIEQVGLDPGFVIPIVMTVLVSMFVWWVVSNLFG